MTSSRRIFLRTGAALAACGVLGGRARAQTLKSVTYITPYGNSVGYAPDYYASGAGLFQKNGIDVKIVGGTGSTSAITQVVAGQALIGRTGGIDVIKAVATANAPIRAVGTICHTSVFVLVSDAQTPYRTAKELAGKTVGIVSAGGGTEDYLNIVLAQAGLPKDAVKRQVVGNSPGAYDLVKLKRIDAFICDDSVVVALQARKSPIVVCDLFAGASVPGQVYVCSEKGIAEQHDAILGFLRATRAAIGDIVADKTGAETVKILTPFNLPDLRDPTTGWDTIVGAEPTWDAKGADARMANIPDAWTKGWQEMAAAGMVAPGDAARAYTMDFTKQL